MTACACNWPLNINVMLRKLFLVETAAILTKSRILKNGTTFESDTQLFLKGLDMYNNKITRKLVLMKWTLTPPQSQDYSIASLVRAERELQCSIVSLCRLEHKPCMKQKNRSNSAGMGDHAAHS